MPQSGEHVFIVGGTSGIGLALAQAAASLGATVTIAGRGAERAAEVARSSGPGARGVHIDLLDSGSITEALRGDERIDHLVLTPVYPGNQSVRDFDAEDSPRWQARVAAGAGQAVDAFKARTPTRHLATVDDVVHGAFFLMDNRAANGIDLELDGGIQLV